MKHVLFYPTAILSTAILSCVVSEAFSQNVGINSTGAAPAASAMLDIASSSSGLLIPRVALTAANTAGPVTSPAVSLLVYNTATAGTAPNDVSPGYYYWDGAKWVAFGGTGGKDWSLTGNSGTTASSSAIGSAVNNNFIGTTTATDFVVATNNLERMRVLSAGQVAVNSVSTFATSTFFSAASGNNDAVDGSAAGTGSAVYGQNTGTGLGVRGLSNNINGEGVMGSNINTSGTGALFVGQNTTGYTITGGSGLASNGNSLGIVAYGNAVANSWGINAAGNFGNTSTITGGGGGSFGGTQWGAFGFATTTTNTTDRAALIGNYNYTGSTGATVYVGARVGGTHYKILGSGGGSVSTTMQTRDGEKILFAPESPENWFFDIGEVQLINGKATVTIDPLFVDCLSDSKPFKVFVQGGENTMGSIRITRNQQEKTFVVEDLGGSSNGVVQYSIYGIWNGKENLRFPEFKPEWHQKMTTQERVASPVMNEIKEPVSHR